MKKNTVTAALRARVFFLLGVIGVTFAVFTIKLFSLQILRGFEYRKKARLVSERIISIPAPRGEIYDRHAEIPLVLNIDSFAVDIIPAEISNDKIPDVVERLGEVLGIMPDLIMEKMNPEKPYLFQPLEIVRSVTREKVFHIAEHIDEFPGVRWRRHPIRSYLETGSIAHVLGYVNSITTEELQILYNKGYKPGDIVGKRGIEKQYDEILRGKDGVRIRTVDVIGRQIEDAKPEIIEPEIGKDVILTIDRRIQLLSEKALGNRIGSVVVLKPATGEVLALVSFPWYNPNLFYSDREGTEYARLSLDGSFPFLNRAVQSGYAPASTFKILMTTALLEEKAINPLFEIECEGSMQLGDRIFRCWKEYGHGNVNLATGLAESCNIYFITSGVEYLGIEHIADYMHEFGLGKVTGIDLPGEISGLAPSPQWKELTLNQRWVGGDTANASIGQGYTTVTPLQMANVVAMIANRGVVYRPFLLKEIRDPISGALITKTEPSVQRTSAVSKETFGKVQELMRGVVEDGTAKVVVTTEATPIAGKTGTGEVGLEDHWNSWFVAFAPYDGDAEEMVVVVVMVEAVNEWEWWAPKAANIIFQGIFADQDYEEAVDALDVWYLEGE